MRVRFIREATRPLCLRDQRNALDLDARTEWQLRDLYRAPRRLIFAEILCIDFVEGREVRHVGEEAGRLHHLRGGGTGRFEHGGEIIEHALCLHANVALDQFAGCGVKRNLPGGKDEVTALHCLRVWPDCLRCIVRLHDFHVAILPPTPTIHAGEGSIHGRGGQSRPRIRYTQRMRATVSVAIVTFNGRHLLEPCLRALFAGSRLPDEVIIVDNASRDGTTAWLAETYPSVRCDCCAANLGFAAANNRAIRVSSGTYVLTLNNDTEVSPDTLSIMVRALHDAGPTVGAVMPIMVFAESPQVIACAGLEAFTNGVVRDVGVGKPVSIVNEPYPIFGPSAGAALYRRTALDDVGWFDPAFFMYLEDSDLAWRLRLRQWETLAVPKAIVRHTVSATAGYGSPRKAYYLARNRWWCLLKNMPAPLLRCYAYDLARYDAAAIAYATLSGDRASLLGRRDAFRDLATILHARATIQSRLIASTDEIASWLLPSAPLAATLWERRAIRTLIGK